MQTSENKRQYETDLGTGSETGRRIPMPYGQVNSQGCGKNGDEVKQERNRSNHQGNAIITGSVIFQIFYFPFALPLFKLLSPPPFAIFPFIFSNTCKQTSTSTSKGKKYVMPSLVSMSGLAGRRRKGRRNTTMPSAHRQWRQWRWPQAAAGTRKWRGVGMRHMFTPKAGCFLS